MRCFHLSLLSKVKPEYVTIVDDAGVDVELNCGGLTEMYGATFIGEKLETGTS